MPGKSQREERCGTGSCWVWHFLKARILNLFFSQPSPFCFILSLFFISGTLALLGLYIKGDHMPDLDSMKVSMLEIYSIPTYMYQPVLFICYWNMIIANELAQHKLTNRLFSSCICLCITKPRENDISRIFMCTKLLTLVCSHLVWVGQNAN